MKWVSILAAACTAVSASACMSAPEATLSSGLPESDAALSEPDVLNSASESIESTEELDIFDENGERLIFDIANSQGIIWGDDRAALDINASDTTQNFMPVWIYARIRRYMRNMGSRKILICGFTNLLI